MVTNLSGALAAAGNAATGAGLAGGASQAGAADTSFGDLVHAGVQQATGMESNAHAAVVGLLSGQGVEVHGAMIATQQAELAFELALQVRNKAVAAYQQMMQMQF